MNFFNRIQNKLLAAFLLVVLLPLIGTGLYGNWITSNILRDRALHDAHSEAEGRARQIEIFLSEVGQDVLFLSRLNSLQGLIEARSAQDETAISLWRRRVLSDFQAFSEQRGIYYQVRYLTEDGMEFVRVDSNGFHAYPVAQKDLQDKSQRYYFQETRRLAQDEVFVSRLDLNREHGKIEIPYQPVIRYATPVFDRQGTPYGIVILNVFADRFLDVARRESARQQGRFLLVDQDGYYLVNPNPTREWGGPSDLNSGARLQDDFPGLASMLLAGKAGADLGERALVYIPVFPNAEDGSFYWVLIYDGSIASLFSPIRDFRTTAILILVSAVAVAILMAMGLARSLTAPIRSLQEGVEALSKGELQQPVQVASEDEIGELSQAFNKMALDLDRTRGQRQRLLERLIDAQEEERRLVAFDIHDGLIQRLVGARMQLSNYLSLRGQDENKAELSLERSLHHLGAAISEGRRLIEGLRPTVLDDLGLVAAVQKDAVQTAQESGCELEFESNLANERLSSAVEITVFRIAQEALSNVRKHAHTKKLCVELTRTGRTLILVVQDWGQGYDPSSLVGGQQCVGLMSMRERASLLGGRLELHGAPGEGAVVRLNLPLTDAHYPSPAS